MTPKEAACLICARCAQGQPAERFTPGAAYFFHGTPFVRCDASPIWDAAAQGAK